jgi:hypothetical protein
MADPVYPKNTTTLAAVALFLLAGILFLGLLGWFRTVADPWTWQSVLTLVCGVAAAALGVLALRRPSQAVFAGGVAIMSVSALRVGDPWDWTNASWVIVIGTCLLVMPVLRALLVVRQIDQITRV